MSSTPSLSSKVILITGANSGIGKATALSLATLNPAQIWIAARNLANGDAAVAEIKAAAPAIDVRFVECDLASFDSVARAAREVVEGCGGRLDVLMLNAGIMGGHPGTTPQGHELQFGTNHVGHALLLKLLTPALLSTAETTVSTPRVVSVSSRGHAHTAALPAGGITFDTLKSSQADLSGVNKYTQSKLANVVYARQYALHYPQIISVAIHPGDVLTEIFNKGAGGGDEQIKYLAREVAPKRCGSLEEGIKNGVWAATAEGVLSGRYYEPVGVLGMGSELSKDTGLGVKLWAWTQREIEGWEL
ncbi:uncharacterized protein J4E79_004406 [Alternaria viburni]|uniref:uncharacterized protein n=1 Tax=Alternaria viburni TaxID=566460 RepID=UPI0020C3194F|nr:uncharacterized protein J4E79_004406 [Alternaria viburni]KAI4663092.1 hypothetical protein J4E79_004406 [Alternaria viburni]